MRKYHFRHILHSIINLISILFPFWIFQYWKIMWTKWDYKYFVKSFVTTAVVRTLHFICDLSKCQSTAALFYNIILIPNEFCEVAKPNVVHLNVKSVLKVSCQLFLLSYISLCKAHLLHFLSYLLWIQFRLSNISYSSRLLSCFMFSFLHHHCQSSSSRR